MTEGFDTQMFGYLDGCNMDDRFEFSFYKTCEEFEANRREWEKFNEEFEKERQAGKYHEPPGELLIDFDGETLF